MFDMVARQMLRAVPAMTPPPPLKYMLGRRLQVQGTVSRA